MLKAISTITNALGALNYKGTWNALTNSPALADGTGAKGDYYVTSTAGTQTFGGLQLFFGIGDWIVYNGAVWQRVEGGSDGNFANVTLTSTDAGAAAAPLLDLYRDSASPAASDTLGEIEFNGEDSAGNKQQYAVIHGSILSPTSTAEAGQIHFETATAGASTEKMIIGTTNLVINDIGAVFNVRIEGDTDANLFYTDATNSRVGVGTISPSTKLEVSGVATAQSFVPSAATVATNGLYLPAANAVGISTNSTNAVYIDSSQKVMIGVTSPVSTEKFNVTNASGVAVRFDGSTTAGIFTGDDLNNYITSYVSKSGTAGPHYQIAFINSTPAVVGSITHNDTLTSFNTVSDYRLKKDITPMTGALATIAQLNPVRYKWKSNNSDGQGFIAHELQAVVPDCVVGEKDALDAEGNPSYQNIDTSFLVATLTAAIKELKAEFDAYKAGHP